MAQEERKPFVPGFQEDVFLSFAHVDNGEDWVSDLHSFLDLHLRELLGRNVRTWRDPKMQAGDALWETLAPTIAGSAVFVSILSPGYIESPTCVREARHFHATSRARGSLLVDTTCRLVQVIKAPFEHSPETRFLAEIESLQSRFFEPRKFDGIHFNPFPSRVGLPRYADFHTQAENLAQSLAGILQKMRAKLARAESGTSRVRVFLAEVTSDRKDDRAFVVNEIADRCDLVPAEALPHTLEELTLQLSGQLAGCALSVHLLGSRFGLQPEGEEARSLPEVQLDQAAGIRRLVWIPENLAAVEERQERFLAQVEACRDARLEVVARQGLPDFIQHLKDVLQELARPSRAPVLGKAIYVVSDPRDLARQELRQLRNCILRQGLRIEDPVFEADKESLRLAEEQALRDSNAVLFYWGEAPDTWVKMRRKAISKTLATLEHGARYQRALYLSAPEGGAKGLFKDLPEGLFPEEFGPPLVVLGDCGEFDCGKLTPLLRSLGGSGA